MQIFNKNKIWSTFEYLLGLVALVSLFWFISLSMSSELIDPDIWLHIKTGEYILQHQIIPHQDIFSFTMSGKEWIDHSWLVQIIFYSVFRFFGPDNLILLSASIVVTAFLLLFLSVYQKRHLTLIISIFALAVFASGIRFNIRPENFSLLFFSIYIFILARLINTKWIYFLVLVQLFWVNCHGFFILGPLLIGIFILGEGLKKINILPWQWNKVDQLSNRTYKNLVIVFFLTILISFINPYGYKGVFYPFWVIINSTGNQSVFYNRIIELLPVWRIKVDLIWAYYYLAIIPLVIFLLEFRRVNVTYLIAWLFFLGLSFKINRNIIFFNALTFYLIARTSINLAEGNRWDFFNKFFGKSVQLFKYIIIIFIILTVTNKNVSLFESSYFVPEEGRFKSSLLGIPVNKYPDKALDFLQKNKLPDNLYNQFNYSSYLIYRLFPSRKVFVDGRTELYGAKFFADLERINLTDEEVLNRLFKKYNINTVFLFGPVQDIYNLSTYLFHSPDWGLVYFNDALIFVKKSPENLKLVEKLKIDFSQWKVLKIDIKKIGLISVLPKLYLQRAWLLYYFGLLDQAVMEANEALRIMPSSAEAYNILARVCMDRKLYDQAFEYLRLAKIYGPNYIDTFITQARLYKETNKFDLALKVYQRLVRSSPHYDQGYYLLGQFYAQRGNFPLAIKTLNEAIKLNPYSKKYGKALQDVLNQSKIVSF